MSFIEFDFMPFEQRAEFVLKTHLSMIREQPIAMFLRNQRLSVFRAVNEMHQVFDEGLGHECQTLDRRRAEGAPTNQPRAPF